MVVGVHEMQPQYKQSAL